MFYLFRDGSESLARMLCADVEDVNLRLKASSDELVHLNVFTIKLQTTNLQHHARHIVNTATLGAVTRPLASVQSIVMTMSVCP